MEAIGSVDSVRYLKENYDQQMEISQECLSDKYLSYVKKNDPGRINEKKGTVRIPVNLSFLQDDVFREYLQEKNMDAESQDVQSDVNVTVTWRSGTTYLPSLTTTDITTIQN